MSNQPPPDLTHRMPPKKCLFDPARTPPVTFGTSRLCWLNPAWRLPSIAAEEISTTRICNDMFNISKASFIKQVGWPNGKALDYESRDCRFDPCVDHVIVVLYSSTTFSCCHIHFCHLLMSCESFGIFAHPGALMEVCLELDSPADSSDDRLDDGRFVSLS
jgi:hypothetical protein